MKYSNAQARSRQRRNAAAVRALRLVMAGDVSRDDALARIRRVVDELERMLVHAARSRPPTVSSLPAVPRPRLHQVPRRCPAKELKLLRHRSM